ncbi:hypothetical protein EDD85DRAFT_930469 [Armillaria nabsnona]|nr:hypothetical protein EDD85DRAFT_930469 [Armillaria nabsnona]
MGVAESSLSFYSPSNKPSDVSYHVSTLSKFSISFLRRYELGTMRHLKKTHICVVFTSWVLYMIGAQLDIGEYNVWLDRISPTSIVLGDRSKVQKLLSEVAS